MDFFDLKKQYRDLKTEIDAAVLKTLESGVFIGGTQVEEFESKAARFLGVKHAVTVNSGTDAIYLSLRALDIGPGDEVITTTLTFIATAEAIAACGAKPVFVDIDPATFNIDASRIEAAITKNTKAIMPVHLFGQMADMAAIKKIAQKFNLKIIEDCAQAIGATQIIDSKELKAGLPAEALAKAGTIGDTGCFSFFPTKNLGAYGDGGMVTTDNDEIAARIKTLKTHGSSPENKYKNLAIGINSRLDSIQAAVLNVKIKYLDKWNEERALRGDYYNKRLAGVGDIVTPFVADGNRHVYHQYTVRTAKRDDLVRSLKDSGIPTMVYFPIAMHLQPALGYLGCKAGDFPAVEKAVREVVSLPIYPELGSDEQETVIQKIKEFFK